MAFNKFDFSQTLNYTSLRDEKRLPIKQFIVTTGYTLPNVESQTAEETKKSLSTKLTNHQL
jgi:hypothetical protein